MLTKNIVQRRHDKGKEAGLGVPSCGKVRKYMGKVMRDKCYFSRFVGTDSLWHQLFVSGHKNVPLLLVQWGALFSQEIICPAFR